MSGSQPLAMVTALPLVLSVAPAQAGSSLAEQVLAVLEKARPALLWHLERAAQKRGHVGPGALALLCLAALHDGLSPDDPILEKALERLARARPHRTYDLALRLMVLEAYAGFPDREHIARSDLRDLLRNRHDGAFGYTARPDGWDLSNTQYAALGMRAAASIGVEVPRRVWRQLFEAMTRAQLRDGSFGYSGRDSGRGYASMTVAGIAVMEICTQALAEHRIQTKGVKGRLQAAWSWMARHKAAIGDLKTRSCFYFHYGLERAAILSEREEVGGRDWYAEGARMLVGAQLRRGGWESETDHWSESGPGPRGAMVPTAFAILFLRRKFQRVAGPITGPRGPALDSLDAQATDDQVQEAARTAWSAGRRSMPDVLRALLSDIATRRQAAAIALYRITGDDFGYNPHRGAEHNAEAIRAAELWYLKNK